jgi:hypothetical protein
MVRVCDILVFGAGFLGSCSAGLYQSYRAGDTYSDDDWWKLGTLTATCVISLFGLCRSLEREPPPLATHDLAPGMEGTPQEITAQVNELYKLVCPGPAGIDLSCLNKLQAIHAKYKEPTQGGQSPRRDITGIDPVEVHMPHGGSLDAPLMEREADA